MVPINDPKVRAGTLRWNYNPQQNIVIKKTINNYGPMFPMPNYNYNTELTKGEKWMLGLSGAAAALGIGLSIYNAVTGNNTEKVSTPPVADTPPASEPAQDITDEVAERQRQSEEKQRAESEALKQASEEYQRQNSYIAGAREIQTIGTSTYKVRSKKLPDGKVAGDVGYNIVAGKYKNADGKPLTDTEIRAITREIFKGQALSAGDIELPNSITVGGKTYTYDKNGTVKEVTYEISDKGGQLYQSGAKQVGSYWVATLNGKDLEGQYESEELAKAAAEAEGAKGQAS